jgi:hypothetical protein
MLVNTHAYVSQSNSFTLLQECYLVLTDRGIPQVEVTQILVVLRLGYYDPGTRLYRSSLQVLPEGFIH